MFMSLSSTTRTVWLAIWNEATSLLRRRTCRSGLRGGVVPVLRVGEELRVVVDLGRLPQLLDALHGLVLLHLRRDPLLHLRERRRVPRPHLENVHAVTRGDGGADLPFLHRHHAGVELLRQHAGSDLAEEAAARGA